MYWSTTFDAAVVVRVPCVLEDLGARDDRTRVAHEQLEHRHLLRRELEVDVAAERAVRRGVQAQVADLERRGSVPGPRRMSARTRAASSAKLNGFVT